MNSPPNHSPRTDEWLVDDQEQIQDYLDYLCAPLIGIVPYAQRRRLRAEATDHLLNLADTILKSITAQIVVPFVRRLQSVFN